MQQRPGVFKVGHRELSLPVGPALERYSMKAASTPLPPGSTRAGLSTAQGPSAPDTARPHVTGGCDSVRTAPFRSLLDQRQNLASHRHALETPNKMTCSGSIFSTIVRTMSINVSSVNSKSCAVCLVGVITVLYRTIRGSDRFAIVAMIQYTIATNIRFGVSVMGESSHRWR